MGTGVKRAGAGLLIALVGLLAAGPRGGGAASLPGSLEVGGRTRTWTLHVPPGLAADRPAPLVLVFHGGGGTGRGMERLTRFGEVADREGFLVAYPDGVERHWNDGRETAVSRAHRERIDDVGFIAALLDVVARRHPVDPRRIYATGISNGAIFSHYLAAHLSGRIAAIAPVVGGLADPFHRAFRPAEPVSVLIIQGTRDPLVPYDGGEVGFPARPRGRIVSTDEAVRLWVERSGAARRPAREDLPDRDPGDGCRGQRLTWSGGSGGAEVALIRLEGGGHTWPGGPQYLPERLVGRVCRDLDATRLIWDFFEAHPRP